ncbi:TrkH family potassium uptake protein [Candidatus Bathyarchaeota archaeon]|nr:TrkH family potassium uptake protein [Candidatus Bathyarchaeota archaeon]
MSSKTIAALLANMGFILQVSGILTILPIVASFLLNETSETTIALFITSMSFLVLGFLTNSLCEKKEMTYKQSCILIVSVFVILSIIGSIPYMYIQITSGDMLALVTDSLFESVSGYTSTGFTIIPDLSVLPQSIILYRALTQFIGGIGIVLVLLAFFYPEAKLKEFARSMGYGKNNNRIKKTFLFIIGLDCVFTAVMIAIGYAFGYHDVIALASSVFSAVSTGGFSPVNDFNALVTQTPLGVILPICMVFGASNILVFAGLFRKKFKEYFNSEITVLLVLIAALTAIMTIFYGLNSYDAGFHVISAMSTCGFSYLPLSTWGDSLKLLLVTLMFVGGASFSTAGGVKIYRIMLLLKSVPTTVANAVTGKEIKVRLFEKEYDNSAIIQTGIMVFLTSALIIVSSLVVSYSGGFNWVDALFECTAAVGTTGLSVGIASPSMALGLKWLFMALMLVGRVEIIVFLVMFSRVKEKRVSNGNTYDFTKKTGAESMDAYLSSEPDVPSEASSESPAPE